MATNSILDNLDGSNTISTIMLQLTHPNEKEKTFVIVEGDDDCVVFSRLLSDKVCIIKSYGSKNAIDEIIPQHFNNQKRVIGIRDRDYQKKKAHKKIFYCDFCCLEMMIIASVDFTYLCNELFSAYKHFRTNTDYDNFRNQIFKKLHLLSCIRKGNEVKGWRINLKGIKPSHFNDESISNLEAKLISEINRQNSANGIDIMRKSTAMRYYRVTQDFLEITNGHDFVDMFVCMAKMYNGSLAINRVETAIKAMFTRTEFENTNLFSQLIEYQNQHALQIV